MTRRNDHLRSRSRAPHRKLEVYHLALRLFAGVEEAACALPRGHADLKDQMRRSAAAVVRAIAEGAGRWSPRDKAHRYTIAAAECTECSATLEMAALVGAIRPGTAATMIGYADRVGAMLTRLILAQSARARE